MRLVLDSNATVSRYISPNGAPAEIFRQWELGTFDIVVSDHVLAEYRRALGYPRVRSRHHMDEDEIEIVVEAIRARAIVVASTTLPAPV